MKKIAVFSLVINFSFIAIAKPVHIDDILTQKEKFSVSLSISYMNFENSDEIILPATSLHIKRCQKLKVSGDGGVPASVQVQEHGDTQQLL